MLAALLAAAALALRPPDGTYTYLIDHGMRSVVTISSAPNGVVVREHVSSLLSEAFTTTVYDPMTLRQQSYSVDAMVAGKRATASVVVAPDHLDITPKNQKTYTLHPALDGTLPLYLMDTNMSLPAMLPSIAATEKGTPIQVLVGANLPARLEFVESARAPRPAGVPSADRAEVLHFALGDCTMWYSPSTFVLDAWAERGLSLRLL